MSKMPRLLDVQVCAYQGEWEWRLVDQEGVVMSGLKPSREQAQKEGDSALFAVLSAGRATPFKKDQK
jgi:hypothetical protein